MADIAKWYAFSDFKDAMQAEAPSHYNKMFPPKANCNSMKYIKTKMNSFLSRCLHINFGIDIMQVSLAGMKLHAYFLFLVLSACQWQFRTL